MYDPHIKETADQIKTLESKGDRDSQYQANTLQDNIRDSLCKKGNSNREIMLKRQYPELSNILKMY